ncbi:MAG: hypothetical protein VW270_05810 [Candidatus Poseidoniales archaeon]|jgi:hypothetical protein
MGFGKRRMIAAILLVFTMNDLPPKVSQRKFVTLDECADFVELLAGQPVVDDEYHFKFESMEPSDGSISTFQGRCVVESNVEKPI